MDIAGLNLAIVPSNSASKTKRTKGKGAGHELELLSNAELRLKTGVHYALLGRNGTGKSSKCSRFIYSFKSKTKHIHFVFVYNVNSSC